MDWGIDGTLARWFDRWIGGSVDRWIDGSVDRGIDETLDR